MGRVVSRGVGNSATTAAVVGVFIAVTLAGVADPAEAAPGVVGASGAPAPISYFTGGPPPPGCEPDSPDPACQPPPAPPPCICGGLPGARRNCMQECQRQGASRGSLPSPSRATMHPRLAPVLVEHCRVS
jgi:hypothetical protein